MIPILYDKSETRFIDNGLGRLTDCLRCIVTEERNGIYECEFDYPVEGQHYEDIVEGRIIAVTHNETDDIQPFVIYSRSATIDGLVTIYAHHISYRLGNIVLKPFTADSCAEALQKFGSQTYTGNPFTFWTDKRTAGAYNLRHPASAKEMLGGTAGSILDVYGKGEYEWDKFTVRLYLNRGHHTDVEIRYGKNLADLRQEIDESQRYNAVAPYWYSEESGETVVLPKGILYAEVSSYVPTAWTANTGDLILDNTGNVIEFMVEDRTRQIEPLTTDKGETLFTNTGEPIELYAREIIPVPMDLSADFENAPTVEQLRNTALRKLTKGKPWVPKENIEVDFVQLWQTDEYASVAPLQRVGLCDTVSVIHPTLGIRAENVKVIKTVYNVLLGRYDKMELGEARTSFAEAVRATTLDSVMAVVVSTSDMARAIESQTRLITGGLGGSFVIGKNADGKPEEALFMNTDDKLTATQVLRINKNGIGFGKSYNGPFTTAWTLDGVFNANFIGAGKIDAVYIDADHLHVKAANINGTLTIGQLPNTVAQTGDIPTKVSSLTNDSGYQTATQVTTITNNTIKTTNVVAQNLQVNAANINGTLSANRIVGGTLTLGTFTQNGVKRSASLEIRSNDESIGVWNEYGLTTTGSIKNVFRIADNSSLTTKIYNGRVEFYRGTWYTDQQGIIIDSSEISAGSILADTTQKTLLVRGQEQLILRTLVGYPNITIGTDAISLTAEDVINIGLRSKVSQITMSQSAISLSHYDSGTARLNVETYSVDIYTDKLRVTAANGSLKEGMTQAFKFIDYSDSGSPGGIMRTLQFLNGMLVIV